MKYYNILTIIGFISVLFLSFPVLAEGDTVDADQFLQGQSPKESVKVEKENKPASDTKISDTQKSLELAKKELEDKAIFKEKMDLANKMHQIRSTREQVDSAVNKASYSLPKNKRKSFVDSMSMMLNYNAIERISIDAMIGTFTLLELKAMVEYYSKPEARSASKKVPFWVAKVQPEIISMIDKALMRIRTGQ